MKTARSKTHIQEQIASFFARPSWTAQDFQKIKRLSMKYRLKLKPYKRLFCRHCQVPLSGSIRVTKNHKTVICNSCGKRNRMRIR